MYSTCVSCNGPLGRNEVLEPFPVGRRLAFDAEKGRLWVLCPGCRSWNLAPIEERWEAVEEAERLFEGAPVGASTENVALARVREGTELLRIGPVERPELAGWRYGDRLLGRWRQYRKMLGLCLGGGAVFGLVPVLLPVVGLAAPLVVSAAGGGWVAWELARARVPFMRTAEGRPLRLSDGTHALLLPTPTAAGWALEVPRRDGPASVLEGRDALRALRGFLPRMNPLAPPARVMNAVHEVERLGSPERVIRESAIELGDPENIDARYKWTGGRPHRVVTGHPVIRLALEIAANEEVERRALEGELALLEREWREAEELAAISDGLLFPRALAARLRRVKGEGESEE